MGRGGDLPDVLVVRCGVVWWDRIREDGKKKEGGTGGEGRGGSGGGRRDGWVAIN